MKIAHATSPAAELAGRDGKPSSGLLGPGSLRHLEKSLKKQGRTCRKELKACQERFSVESVHEFRIATRRLLAMLDLLAGLISPTRVKTIRDALKEHLDNFDDLRDTQVQIGIVATMTRRFAASAPFHAWLRSREKRFARKARKEIRRLRSHRIQRMLDDARDRLRKRHKRLGSEAATAVLLLALDDAFTRTCHLRSLVDVRHVPTIHRARVAFKRFRYMVEAVAPNLPGVSPKLLTAMRRYQTRMGDIQDTEVLLHGLDDFLRKGESDPAASLALRQEILRRRTRLIAAYLRTADQLLRFWPPPSARSKSKSRADDRGSDRLPPAHATRSQT